METSTFSLAAHSLTRSVEALLAPGTQWSQKPIDSLPAAWAPRTYGAVTRAADDSAVAAMNCRRESFLRDMWFPLCLLLFCLLVPLLIFIVLIALSAIAVFGWRIARRIGCAIRTE